MLRVKILLFAAVLIVTPMSIKSQSFEETLGNLSTIAAKKYIEPAMTAFGSNLNSGWVNQVPGQTILGFDLNIKIVGMGTFLNDKAKTFATAGVFRFNSSQADDILANSGITSAHPAYAGAKQELLSKEWNVNFSGPTIIGKDTDRLKINFPGGTVSGVTLNPYVETVNDVKGLLNEMPILPTGAPQITVGTVMGTQVMVRYLPSIEIDKLGKMTFSGFGIIHNPGAWLNNPLPVDLGIGFFTQSLKIGSIVESTATQYGIFVSKTIGAIISIVPYAGFTIESSKTTVNYDFEYSTVVNGTTVNAKDKINFEIEGENSSSFVVGATIKLAVVNLNVDYKMAKYNTLSAGVSFGF